MFMQRMFTIFVIFFIIMIMNICDLFLGVFVIYYTSSKNVNFNQSTLNSVNVFFSLKIKQ